MFKFQNNAETWQRLDYHIMSRGFIKPYNDEMLLETDLEWLRKENYSIVNFDCLDWNNHIEVMHDDLSLNLHFPPYYGKNWDALYECLNELEISESGTVVVFKNLDMINIKTVHTLIDCFVSSAQRHILFNERLLVLIKVDNQKFELHPLGAFKMHWY
ncbi:barstar family protein [Flavobacterium sp. AG291]|uniref:barstar family protein n=1 Tax=Flavobacterium sp. AG291 TaxID=2184000 RepID=UPI000E0C6F24|nr:barstar family protein [Flavobacterium sp. AG291]RDI15920.1 barstar (barnase inhibitor) [Flavobacterium sp. AG291]